MSTSGFEPPRPGDAHPSGNTPAAPGDNTGWWAAPQQQPGAASPQQPPHAPAQHQAHGQTNPYGQQFPTVVPDQPSYPPTAQPAPQPRGVGRRGVVAACLGTAVLASALTAGGVSVLDNSGSSSAIGGSAPSVSIPSRPDGAVDWAAVAGKTSPSVVNIRVSSATGSSGGSGSGTILDKNGNILTNAHVADAGGGSANISILLTDGRVFTGVKVVGTDKSSDLAVLKIPNPPKDLIPITLGNSDEVAAGQPVMAIGSPLGLADTVTTGIVSAINRPVVAGEESAASSADLVITNAIQTDAAINPGNSGGALVNSSGQMIGIPSSINTLAGGSGQGGSIGLGFAIPINEANRIAKELIASGRASHAWLGVELGNGGASSGGVTRMGAKVSKVVADAPAAKAGLAPGDVVVKIDSAITTSADGLSAQIRQRAPGDRVKLTYVRGGSTKTVDVTLGRKNG